MALRGVPPQILVGAYLSLHKGTLYDAYAVCGRLWPLIGILLAISLAGFDACSNRTSFHAADISSIMPPLEFKLTGEGNKPVTE